MKRLVCSTFFHDYNNSNNKKKVKHTDTHAIHCMEMEKFACNFIGNPSTSIAYLLAFDNNLYQIKEKHQLENAVPDKV